MGLCSGGAIGLGANGRRRPFPERVLWSAGVVYFTGLALAAPFRFGAAPSPPAG